MSRETAEQLIARVTRRIGEVRDEAGVTQEQLAERLETDRSNYRRIEDGQNVTLSTLARIAAALDVPVERFFEPPKNPPRPRRRQRRDG